MKSSNLARRYEIEEPQDSPRLAEASGEEPPPNPPMRAYRPFSLDDRAIVIRDQGFRPFRVR